MATKLTFTKKNNEYVCSLPGTKGVLQVQLAEQGAVAIHASVGGLPEAPIHVLKTTYSLAPICELAVPDGVTLTARTNVAVTNAQWIAASE